MIECTNLKKVFHSATQTVTALESLSLKVERNEVVGIAGPNGAGKSTLIALLLGYLRPTAGTVRLAGMAPRPYVQQFGVGYLSEQIGIHPRWRTDHALARFGLLAGLSDAEITRQSEALMDLLGLDEHRTKAVRALSKGNLQRLGLAQALLGDPDLVILDEPTHGFDPMWVIKFRDVMRGLRRPGRAILIASHDLSELSALADRVVIIDHGRVVRTVDTHAAAPVLRRYRLLLAAGAEHVMAVFPNAEPLGADGTFELDTIELEALNVGLAELLRRGARIAAVAPSETLLEYHFREAVEGAAS